MSGADGFTGQGTSPSEIPPRMPGTAPERDATVLRPAFQDPRPAGVTLEEQPAPTTPQEATVTTTETLPGTSPAADGKLGATGRPLPVFPEPHPLTEHGN